MNLNKYSVSTLIGGNSDRNDSRMYIHVYNKFHFWGHDLRSFTPAYVYFMKHVMRFQWHKVKCQKFGIWPMSCIYLNHVIIYTCDTLYQVNFSQIHVVSLYLLAESPLMLAYLIRIFITWKLVLLILANHLLPLKIPNFSSAPKLENKYCTIFYFQIWHHWACHGGV